MYADDTHFWHFTFDSNYVVHLEQNINNDLTKITEWLTENNLTLNKSERLSLSWLVQGKG